MRIRSGHVHLNYELSGSGSTVVLTHGLGSDLHYWDGAAEALGKYHQVLRWDVRGFGASDKPAGPYSPEMLATDLALLLDTLRLGRVHLAGLSMGGVIAQRFALDHPEQVRSLVLASTSSEVGPRAAEGWRRLADRVERRGFDERSVDPSGSFSASFAARHPDIVERLKCQMLRNEPRSYAAAARAMSAYNWTEQLRALTAPVLILQGLEDRLTPPGGAVKMSRALPRSRLVMIPGAGHNLPLEHPLAFHSALLAFFGAVDLLDCQVTGGLVTG